MVSLLSTTTNTLRSLASCSSSAASSSSRRSFSSSPSSLVGRMAYPAFSRPKPSTPYTPKLAPEYPSPLNGTPRRYRKAQRTDWNGPENDVEVDAPVTFKEDNLFVNPDHPMYLTNPDAKPSPWFVKRTNAGDYLPVYTEFKNAAKTHNQTVIRHIEGDPHLLLDSLLRYLIRLRPHEKRASGRVLATSGIIEIKGLWKEEIVEFLLSRGM